MTRSPPFRKHIAHSSDDKKEYDELELLQYRYGIRIFNTQQYGPAVVGGGAVSGSLSSRLSARLGSSSSATPRPGSQGALSLDMLDRDLSSIDDIKQRSAELKMMHEQIASARRLVVCLRVSLPVAFCCL